MQMMDWSRRGSVQMVQEGVSLSAPQVPQD